MTAILNYAFSFLFIASSTSLILLPYFNLHIAKLNENRFLQESRRIIESNRLNPSLSSSELSTLNPTGINLLAINIENLNGYLVYEFKYSYKGLFTNKLFNSDDLQSIVKTKKLIIDQVT